MRVRGPLHCTVAPTELFSSQLRHFTGCLGPMSSPKPQFIFSEAATPVTERALRTVSDLVNTEHLVLRLAQSSS